MSAVQGEQGNLRILSSPGHWAFPRSWNPTVAPRLNQSPRTLPVTSPATILSLNHQACGCSQGRMFCHRQLCLFPGRPRVSLPTPSSSIIREPSPSRGHRLWEPGMVGQQRDPRSEEERALQREAMRMERSSTNPGEGSQSPLWGVTREAALSNKALPQLSSLRAPTFSLGNCFLNGILTQLYHLPATFIYYNSFILVLQSQSCSF